MSPFRLLFKGLVCGLVLLALGFVLERPTLAHAQAGVQCAVQDISGQQAFGSQNFEVIPSGTRVYSYGVTRFRGIELKIWWIGKGIYWIPVTGLTYCGQPDGRVSFEADEELPQEPLLVGVECLRIAVVADITVYHRNGSLTLPGTIGAGVRVYNYGPVGNGKSKVWIYQRNSSALVPTYALGSCPVAEPAA